jgi:class 3 adenylate cyclase/CheY-like chemotaxis protein
MDEIDTQMSKMDKSDKYSKIILKNIKHDLINPINAMIGYSELILDELEDMKEVVFDNDIRCIHQSSSDILAILQNIFSKNIENADDDIIHVISDEKLHYSVRTPLSSVIGLSELILEDTLTMSVEEMKDIRESITKINHSGKGLLRLINSLKKYSELSESELVEMYYTDLYLKESSIRNFEFNSSFNLPVKPGRILIVDDEKVNCELIGKILKQSNHRTFTAESGSEATKVLANQPEQIDLILLDLIMPEISGMELLQKIKNDSKTYHIPIIMLSAMDEMETIVECISLGAEDFLMKPVNKVLLKARINNALEKKYFHDKEIKYQERIKSEQKKSNELLLNILPGSIAERLKNGETLIADDIDCATVLFADLKGFTDLSSKISAKELLMLLNNIFSEFDELLVKHSLEKIKTIGDNYMLAGGIPEPSDNHAISVAEMALDMLITLPKINKNTGNPLQIRIGINSGPVSAGVIGKKKFIYDLWGDTVNVASRMESYGNDGHIHVAQSTYNILRDDYIFEQCPLQDIPGKGKLKTYNLISSK